MVLASVCVRVRVCVRACVPACVRACACVCVCVCVFNILDDNKNVSLLPHLLEVLFPIHTHTHGLMFRVASLDEDLMFCTHSFALKPVIEALVNEHGPV